MLGNLLAFVAFELPGFIVVVLVLIIPLVLALVASVSGFVGRRFLAAILDVVSTLFAKEASTSFHKVLTFLRTKGVYDGIDTYRHGIVIGLRSELVRTTILGVLGGSRRVISSHQLGLTPIVVESDCLCHPSSK